MRSTQSNYRYFAAFSELQIHDSNVIIFSYEFASISSWFQSVELLKVQCVNESHQFDLIELHGYLIDMLIEFQKAYDSHSMREGCETARGPSTPRGGRHSRLLVSASRRSLFALSRIAD